MFKSLLVACLSIFILNLVDAQQIRDHYSFGLGPGIIYGENTGNFSTLTFKVLPAFSFAYNKQFIANFDLRPTLGGQFLHSGGYESIFDPTVVDWAEQGKPHDFKGIAFWADLMPVYHFNPDNAQQTGDVLNFYAGLGLGVMHVARKEKLLLPGEPVASRIKSQKGSTTTAYIPLRIGVSSNLDFDWDYAFEFSALTSTNSELDGNNIQTKLIKPDILFQLQFMVRRYIGR